MQEIVALGDQDQEARVAAAALERRAGSDSPSAVRQAAACLDAEQVEAGQGEGAGSVGLHSICSSLCLGGLVHLAAEDGREEDVDMDRGMGRGRGRDIHKPAPRLGYSLEALP